MRSHLIVFTHIFIIRNQIFPMLKECNNCGEEKEHEAKGLCRKCYLKISWNPEKKECKRCGRKIIIHAKGLCGGCYNFVFHLDKNKAWSRKKYHNINLDTYKKLTLKCIICGFDKLVDLHHLDGNKQNNTEKNLVGLCPNHHKMIHNFEFKKEIYNLLKDKGFEIPNDIKLDFPA